MTKPEPQGELVRGLLSQGLRMPTVAWPVPMNGTTRKKNLVNRGPRKKFIKQEGGTSGRIYWDHRWTSGKSFWEHRRPHKKICVTAGDHRRDFWGPPLAAGLL